MLAFVCSIIPVSSHNPLMISSTLRIMHVDSKYNVLSLGVQSQQTLVSDDIHQLVRRSRV